jgi:hypothetical protein
MFVARPVRAEFAASLGETFIIGGQQMQSCNWVAYVAGVALIVLSAASPALGQTETDVENLDTQTAAILEPESASIEPHRIFTDINDAVPGRFFDAEASTEVGNRLMIGFNSGLDVRTFKYRDFRASTAAYSYTSASDTLTFKVNAPKGFYVARITYSQRGSGLVYRTGAASGAAHWVVNGAPSALGFFATGPTLTQTATLTGQPTSVPVSITNGLFAFSTPQLGSATVSLTGADVYVEFVEFEPLQE